MSWLEFHPERFASPQVIAGLVLMALGLVAAVFARQWATLCIRCAANADADTRKAAEKRRAKLSTALLVCGAAVVLVGAIVVIV